MAYRKDVVAEKFAVSASRLEAHRAGRLLRRNRERHYIRANIHAANERALQRGIITLREFLLATSRLLDVGVGVIVADVPEVEDEVEIPLEPEVVLDELLLPPVIFRPPSPHDNVPHVAEEVVVAPEQEVPQHAGDVGALLCRICVENVTTMVLVPCGHIICTNCLDNINNTCPFCRSDIDRAQRFYV